MLTNKHPLVGTWITDDEDSDVALVVKVAKGRYVVTGFCRSTGEKFKITKPVWENDTLAFNALLPSTKWRTKHVFRILPDGKAEMELTVREVWKKTPRRFRATR